MKIFYLAFLLAFLIQSCEIDFGKDPLPSNKIELKSQGFSGTIINSVTDERISGCVAKFWGPNLDTLITTSDSNGYFNLRSMLPNGMYSLKVEHPYYGVIVNKTVFLCCGIVNHHYYFGYDPFWVNLHLKTNKTWGEADYVEFGLGSYKKYMNGLNLNHYDSTYIFNGRCAGNFYISNYFAYKDSIYSDNLITIPILPRDTVDYTIVF
jgi:hypothetical protein